MSTLELERVADAEFPRPTATQRVVAAWFYTAVLLSGVCVAAIGVNYFLPGFAPTLIDAMQLTHENNVAVWWSGALLLMTSIHAFDAAAAASKRGALRPARAWLSLSAVSLFLSADEIGSLHERLGMVAERILGVNAWFPQIPIAMVLALLLLYALNVFRQDKEHSHYVVPLLLGFGVLGTVPLQEQVEHMFEWPQAIQWLRASVEEGTELLGMLLLLRVVLRPTFEIAGRKDPTERRFARFLPALGPAHLLSICAAAPLFAALVVRIPDGRGQLADWVGVAAFLGAGVAAAEWLLQGRRAERGRLFLLAGTGVVGSIVATALDPEMVLTLGNLRLNTRGVVLSAVSLASGCAWLTMLGTSSHRLVAVVVAIALITVVVPLLGAGTLLTALMTQVLGILTLWSTWIGSREWDRSARGVDPGVGTRPESLRVSLSPSAGSGRATSHVR